LEKLGRASLFWLPVSLHVVQFSLVLWLEKKSNVFRPSDQVRLAPGSSLVGLSPSISSSLVAQETKGAVMDVPAVPEAGRALARSFLRMAWLANPFAYIAMNTVVPLLPDVAVRLNLSTTSAGFVGSVWMFGRLFAFIALWRWAGWHYRFGWLVSAYLLMVLSFAAVLLLSNLLAIVIAELIFGLAVGLIYYSSLFYSMDVGQTKGEHAGFHEALIGVGIFVGPAVGTVTLRAFPAMAHAGIWGVSGLLVVGLVALLAMRWCVKRGA
jgi:MFS family permease